MHRVFKMMTYMPEWQVNYETVFQQITPLTIKLILMGVLLRAE